MTNSLSPVTLTPHVVQERDTSSTIARRLRPNYASDGRSWHHALAAQAEAHTVPTRCCTEVFYGGSQHNGFRDESGAEGYGNGRQTSGGGY